MSSGESSNVTVEKKLAERRRRSTEGVPDLTDFMTDMFFGAVEMENKTYDLTGGIGIRGVEEEEIGFDDSTRSDSSRMTEEWLEEARRVVANSPTNRFLASQPIRSSSLLSSSQPPHPSRSRSARRYPYYLYHIYLLSLSFFYL